jgi:rubredoxin
MQQVLMRQIPAKCGNCGYLFPSGYGISPIDPDTGVDTGVEVAMTGWQNAPVSTPCPWCGMKKGRVLEGEYNFVKDTITLLSGPDSTKEDLERLRVFLRDSHRQGANIEEIRERADKEIPELSDLIRKLLANRPVQIDPIKYLSLICSIIAVVCSVKTAFFNSPEESEPSKVIYECNTFNIIKNPPSGEVQYTVPKVGRNETCPCGSGRKYKKCHGDHGIIQPQP